MLKPGGIVLYGVVKGVKLQQDIELFSTLSIPVKFQKQDRFMHPRYLLNIAAGGNEGRVSIGCKVIGMHYTDRWMD